MEAVDQTFQRNKYSPANGKIINVSLTGPLREWINAQVDSGEYANASDYIRDLIRHDQTQRDALRLALIEGEQSGISKRKVSKIIQSTKARLKNG